MFSGFPLPKIQKKNGGLMAKDADSRAEGRDPRE